MLKVKQKYKTKNGKTVLIKRESSGFFWGEIQDGSKQTVKYDKTGKIPGWSSGNFLDITDADEETEEVTKS